VAEHKSAKKRIRRNARRTEINRTLTSRLRTMIRKVEGAIAAGDKSLARQALRAAQPVIQSSVGKGLVQRNTAARKLSRLSARIKSLSG